MKKGMRRMDPGCVPMNAVGIKGRLPVNELKRVRAKRIRSVALLALSLALLAITGLGALSPNATLAITAIMGIVPLATVLSVFMVSRIIVLSLRMRHLRRLVASGARRRNYGRGTKSGLRVRSRVYGRYEMKRRIMIRKISTQPRSCSVGGEEVAQGDVGISKCQEGCLAVFHVATTVCLFSAAVQWYYYCSAEIWGLDRSLGNGQGPTLGQAVALLGVVGALAGLVGAGAFLRYVRLKKAVAR